MLKQIRRVATVILTGTTTLVVALAVAAIAWHAMVSGHANCLPSSTPRASTTVTITVPDESWVEDDTTASGTASLGGQSKSWAISGAGSATLSFPGVNGGTANVTGEFNTGEFAGGTTSIAAVADCEEESTPTPTTAPPTPTTKPPVDKPEKPKPVKKPVYHGTAINKKRVPVIHKATPPDQHKPPVKKPAPNQLPFTGAGEQAGMAAGGMLLVAGGAFLLRKGAQQA